MLYTNLPIFYYKFWRLLNALKFVQRIYIGRIMKVFHMQKIFAKPQKVPLETLQYTNTSYTVSVNV